MSWRIRNVPSSFKETKFVFGASVVQVAMGVIVLPMVLFVLDSMPDRYILWCLSTCVSVILFISVFFVPKILNATGLLWGSANHGSNSGNKNLSATNVKIKDKFHSSAFASVCSSQVWPTTTRSGEADTESVGGPVDLQAELQESLDREAKLREQLIRISNIQEKRIDSTSLSLMPARGSTRSACRACSITGMTSLSRADFQFSSTNLQPPSMHCAPFVKDSLSTLPQPM
eukprot:comp18537_c0_seq1/m.19974 comp18537_c0_seq1/g.19974  ORF comp18537_c0_seq1/g.19974 comp18537_c0_seq1/m.19974 type:complete len:230 (-) comp18537_c0_seq1:496-1185(-)